MHANANVPIDPIIQSCRFCRDRDFRTSERRDAECVQGGGQAGLCSYLPDKLTNLGC